MIDGRTLLAAALACAMAPGAMGAESNEAALRLVKPISQYKVFVSEHADQLVEDTTAFTRAIKSGDLDKAKSLYAPTRTSYEKIEPIAELFGDLDPAIDARADAFEKKEQDPNFTGFHRIEYGLWARDTTEGLDKYADKLLRDVTDLHDRIDTLTFPPRAVVGGAAALMEEVAASKVSGEEDRYSHTDLWDFRANVVGSRKIFDLVKPLLEDQAPDFVEQVEGNFETVNETLANYRTEDGFALYDKLSHADRTLLSAKVDELAESLSTLGGQLDL